MGKYNLMIRLIDVVFILLFGFIAISQIGISAAIDPAKSSEADQSGPDAPIEVIIGVSSDGSYPVEAGNLVLRNIREVRGYLAQKMTEAAARGVPVGVRIRAAWDSSVEHSLAVARLCRELGIPKGLDVIKMKTE
ncbi:MAG: biopolymer transporter ExbD [candidate division KSB1 bacterium]|nr:biopolymer transporter ExbD [candidate division KSB1 bacterium]MDZ7334166.1 biopolymer transporter ExbD [candidate division KSB1 bacterium]MDZ7376859.1 biopolymer transporter ExbD [candidate division KSB1 bacterium]MDZ7400859.1 biopolymer transporter ExbD [candidate division KSB1 bacterium]